MFITFEGIEGSGKSTQARYLARWLVAGGHACVQTREPGGTPIGRQIRSILLNSANREIQPMTELLLYNADRVQHIQQVIQPALAAGQIVICDRFFDATVVYQGVARGLRREQVDVLHRLMCDDWTPNVTFLMDLEPSVGLGRAWKDISAGLRADGQHRFEEEALAFHERVREGYLGLAEQAPERFCVVDATPDQETVRSAVIQYMQDIFSQKETPPSC